MYVFMHGLESTNYRLLAQELENGAAAQSNFLIPSLVIHHNLEVRGIALHTWHDRLYKYERTVGIRWDHNDVIDIARIDYTKLSRDLNATTTNLAYCTWSCKTTARLLDFMDDIAERYHTLAIKNAHNRVETEEIKTLLLEKHAFLRSWNQGLEDRAEYLAKRPQALVQTVSWTFTC